METNTQLYQAYRDARIEADKACDKAREAYEAYAKADDARLDANGIAYVKTQKSDKALKAFREARDKAEQAYKVRDEAFAREQAYNEARTEAERARWPVIVPKSTK